ncbi:MAG TPA: 3-dehydroquinate synthase [Planctomycetota bacterium]|nr:3-dehydroquinate synthase [Planctomycetota bacterium]
MATSVHTSIVRVPARPEAAYEVRIGTGLLDGILPELRRVWPTSRLCVVTDANVQRAGHLAAIVGDGEVGAFAIEPPGEASKTLRTVEAIVSRLECERYGRDTLLVALGGGVVGDVAGFAAAIFKRGVPCVQVPTTTVAQADSAIGGKVGVDSELSKNAYGAFSHPARVYVDVATLSTLDERHYRAGLVESVKHAMIADAAYFDYLEAHLEAVLARGEAALLHLAERNVGIKGDVVFRDPEEANLRRILNFGHTIGHAVESASGYALHHGEAVAIGIVGACLIAERFGLAPVEVRSRAVALFRRLGVPVSLPPGLPDAQLLDLMARDKKARGGTPRFVLLDDIGKVHCPGGECAAEVPSDVLASVLQGLRSQEM